MTDHEHIARSRAEAKYPNDRFDGKEVSGYRSGQRSAYTAAKLEDLPLHEDNLDVMEEAVLQIRYLHDKFKETGSGNATIAKLEERIAKLRAILNPALPSGDDTNKTN